MNELLPALALSLQVAICALILVTVTSVPLAFLMCRRRSWWCGVTDALLTVPLVLPPTVVGYLLIVLFGRNGWVGSSLYHWFGYTVMFNWHGAVLAAAVVAFPLVYLPSRSAFASVDRELEDVARLHGAHGVSLFWHVSLPLARRGIIAGAVLAFARALGEFGATIMVMGDTARYRTLPLLIYTEYGYGGGNMVAALAVALLIAVSLAVAILHSRTSMRRVPY